MYRLTYREESFPDLPLIPSTDLSLGICSNDGFTTQVTKGVEYLRYDNFVKYEIGNSTTKCLLIANNVKSIN